MLINKQKWSAILQNQERESMLKNMDFYHLLEIYLTNKNGKKLLDAAQKQEQMLPKK